MPTVVPTLTPTLIPAVVPASVRDAAARQDVATLERERLSQLAIRLPALDPSAPPQELAPRRWWQRVLFG
jgi:hypothetical protein